MTAASRTSQLRTIGTVTSSFHAAYDILVRPAGSRTALETETGTVQPNFLSGIYGGISMAQYRRIQGIAGVQVAAPIAMVGYGLLERISSCGCRLRPRCCPPGWSAACLPPSCSRRSESTSGP